MFCENGPCANENFLVANSWHSSRARVSQNTQIFDASRVSSNRQKLLKYAAFLKHKYSNESNIASQKHDRQLYRQPVQSNVVGDGPKTKIYLKLFRGGIPR